MTRAVGGAVPVNLVGRGGELRALDAAVYAARCGTGRVVVVTGPAGIGKSSLCGAARDRYVALGIPVLAGTCLPDAGAGIGYAPFVTAWRHAPGGAGFGDLLAGLAALGPVPAGIARAWLADRLLGQLAAWGADRPVVLIVEDLHWVDPSSRALLDVLARVAGRLPVLIVATTRDEPVPGWLAELAALPYGRALPLRPLGAVATRALARLAGGPGVDAASVLRRGEGHPLFTVELARYRGTDLPPTLRTLLEGRVRELGRDGVRLLAAVALAGGSAGVQTCRAVAGWRRVVAAVEGGLLVLDRPAGRVRLRHALFGEVARDELAPGTGRRLCRQLAVALTTEAAPAAVLGRLWAGAGEPERTRAAWVAAGEEAARGHAYQEAGQAYRQALAIRTDPGTALGAADALRWAGDLDGALDVARTGLSRLAPDEVAGRVRLLDGVRRYLYAAGRAAEAFDVLREAREAAAGLAVPAVVATVEVAEAGRLLLLGRYEEGAATGRRAAALLDAQQSEPVRALAYSTEGMCRAMLGEVDRGLALLAEAHRLAGRGAGVREFARVTANHAYVLANASRYAECARVCQTALDRLGGPAVADALGGGLRYNLVTALVALGRWAEADRECAAGSANPRTSGLLLAYRAGIDAWRGGDRSAALLAEAATLVDPSSPVVAAELAWAGAVAARAASRYREAVAGSRAALSRPDLVAAPGDRLRLLVTALGALADLQLCRGRVRRFDDPALVADELLVERDKAVGAWPEDAVPPEIDLLGRQCAAEAARLRPGGDAAPWHRLAAGWAALAMPFHAGYARLRHAEALVDAGRAGAAGPSLRAAYEEAVRLGAVPLRLEVERVARRARAPLPGGTDGGPSLGVLTRREREVLDLVACGRTNREIAQLLVISERTAGVHVSRILAKLGAGNRAEAAHLARQAPAAGRTKDT
jgi:DNA-binding CsgD family transcriptional regulator/tetratricopeptide (TPR) repeat protein